MITTDKIITEAEGRLPLSSDMETNFNATLKQIDAEIQKVHKEMQMAQQSFLTRIKELEAKKERITVGLGGEAEKSGRFGEKFTSYQVPTANKQSWEMDRNSQSRKYHKKGAENDMDFFKGNQKAFVLWQRIKKGGEGVYPLRGVTPQEAEELVKMVDARMYEDEFDDDYGKTKIILDPKTLAVHVNREEY